MKKFLIALSLSISIAIAIGTHAETQHKVNSANQVLQTVETESLIKVGDRVPEIYANSIDAKLISTDRIEPNGALIIIFTSVECPVVNRYTQRLNRLHKTYRDHGVEIVAIYSNNHDTIENIISHIDKMQIEFPAVKDFDGEIARQFGASMTPEVFLIDAKNVLRYRGAIDDHRIKNRVKVNYLENAIDAIITNQKIKITQNDAFGCTIHLSDSQIDQVNYTRDIAPILQRNCQSCHRPDQVAPFSLLTFEEAKTWSTEIAFYAKERLMPPWKAEPGYGDFQHKRRMLDREIELINEWIENDTAFGDETDLLPPAEFNDSWALGDPDLIVEMPDEYEVEAEGEDEYRHFVIPSNFDRDMFVEAVDVDPGNRQTVHHVIVYLDNSGKARELDAADPKLGYLAFGSPGFDPSGMLGGWAPGISPTQNPIGTGYVLPKGADIVLQIHYYKTGRIERDQSRVGFYFSKHPDPKPIRIDLAINSEFTIPPGESNYEIKAHRKLEHDFYLIAILPHMHLLGKSMKVTATFPDQRKQDLIWIKNWDFNWQENYHYKTPIFIPAGTVIEVIAFFDNSAENRNNPNDPPKAVGWGEKTTDEMCIAFFDLIRAVDLEMLMSHAK